MSKKTIYFDNHCGYLTSAIVEDGKITEFNFEKRENGSIVGNIYKGRVESVLPGMRAAFVNCGLERNCYVSADDVLPDAGKYDSELCDEPSFPELKEGDEILVQVTKAPVDKKGARVTTHPNFVGKCLIYMPETPFVGVSRKITDEELRKNLIFSVKKLKYDNEGLVVRTAAPYAKRKQLEVEINYLRNIYKDVRRRFDDAEVGALLYSDIDLPMRVLRDTLSYDIEKIIVGTEKIFDLIDRLNQLYPPANRRPVVLHDTGRDMLEEYGLADQVLEMASPRVSLDNGAYLVIEKTEALTVIDVNTGRFIGDDSLEQTVYFTNILAAREIARQVRLRNIGGIVVVDFIDMQNAAHRKSLVEELERALRRDKAKCTVSPMSKFGLVEFTRKRVGVSPLALMLKPCKHCRQAGQTRSYELLGLDIRAKLLKLVAAGHTAIRIDLNAELLERLTGWKEYMDDLKARGRGAAVYAVPHRTYGEEQIFYRCKNEDGFAVPSDAVRLT